MNQRHAVGLLAILPLYLAIATAIGYVDFHIRREPDLGYTQYSPQVVAGTEDPPGRYRVLAPYAFEAVKRATGLESRDAWIVFRWLSLLAALCCGHLYYRTWFDTAATLTANTLTMALLPLTFTNSWAHPDHFAELVLFTLGCATIARGWTGAFAVVLALNALNRETSAFLVLLYFAASPIGRRHVITTAALGAGFLAITIGLRVSLGWVAYDPWQIGRNLEFLRWFAPGRDLYYRLYPWFFAFLILPLAWLAARSWRTQPRFLRVASAIVAPAFIVTCFLFSSVIETRIFTPVFPLLVPAVIWGVVRE